MAGLNIIISGYYGFGNAGDEAMLYSIIRSLQSAFPDSQITVISGDPKKTEDVFHIKAIHRFRALEILRGLVQCDLLVSGGGSLLQDVTSWRSLFYYLSIMSLGILMGKKVFLYAQGIGPIRSGWLKRTVATVLNHTDSITVRDQSSKDFLLRIGVKTPVEVTADAVLALSPIPLDEGRRILRENGISHEKKLIGICVRNWGDIDHWAAPFRRYMEALQKESDCQFVFIPMQCPEDMEAAVKICHIGKLDVCLLKDAYHVEELMSLIGNLDLLIGIRLHALIFAALMHVPFIGISYDPKIDNFLYSIDKEAAFSVSVFDEKKLYNMSMQALQEKVSPLQWSKVDNMRKRSAETVHILAKVVQNKGDA